MTQVDFATTTLPTIVLWGAGLAIFLVGGLIGYFNMNMDASKRLGEADQKIAAARAEADRKLAEAQQKLEEARTLAAQAPKATQQVVDAPSLLKVKSDDGFRMQIDMDGTPLTAPLTADRKKRLIELLSHVRPWLEGGTSAPQPVAPVQPVVKPVAAPPTALEPAPVPVVPPAIKPVPAKLTLNPQKPKTDPATEFKLLSMVKQIDVVLQQRIVGTPLETMGIHLNDTLQGGLEVQVGTQKYEMIDDVPDPTIQAAIRAAIAEWEQKYVPGAS